jgi:hypothetical protein
MLGLDHRRILLFDLARGPVRMLQSCPAGATALLYPPGNPMKIRTVIALFAFAFAGSAFAADSTCAAQATEKKLAGAAKTSFLKKCEADAAGAAPASACDTTAKEKKLAGAAKTSFLKKCNADAAAKK